MLSTSCGREARFGHAGKGCESVQRILAHAPADAAALIAIMRRKAAENNQAFRTSTWTPRMVDKVLWTYGR